MKGLVYISIGIAILAFVFAIAAGDDQTFTDTNETPRFTNLISQCPTGQAITAVNNNGSVNCTTILNTTDTNCTADGSCPLITYDSETTEWDTNTSDDLTINTNYSGDITGNYTNLEVESGTFTVPCENITGTNACSDANTEYTAGEGLILTGTEFNISKSLTLDTLNVTITLYEPNSKFVNSTGEYWTNSSGGIAYCIIVNDTHTILNRNISNGICD